jgi:hypothetical protein
VSNRLPFAPYSIPLSSILLLAFLVALPAGAQEEPSPPPSAAVTASANDEPSGDAPAGDRGEALRLAASRGDVAAVRRMLAEGVEVDAGNRYGATALLLATRNGHREVVAALLEAGADVNRKDTFYGFGPFGAAVFGSHEEIAVLLVEHGLEDLDAALRSAVGRNLPKVVAALLATGELSPEVLSEALVAAREKEAGEIVGILEAAGVEPPAASDFDLSAEELERFAGRYRWPERDFETTVEVNDDGALTVVLGPESTVLVATDPTTFRPHGGGGFELRFQVEEGTPVGFVVDQGSGQEITFVRQRQVAAAEEAAPEGEEGAGEPEVAASPGAAAEVAEATSEPDFPPAVADRHWPSFRGPNAAGTARGNPPVRWDVEEGENLLWKTAIPGRGHSSPVVWGDRIFLTTAVASKDEGEFRSGLYGDVDAVPIDSEYSWRLLAVDAGSGEVVWEREAHRGVPRSAHHMKATQANPTPVTDGRHLVVMMGSEGLYAYDLEGELLWKKDLGPLDVGWFYDPSIQWGHASSPILYGDTVIVQVDRHGDPFLAAYALEDGREVWRTERDNMPSWGTPTLVPVGDRHELVTNGTPKIRGYDPETGEELWSLGPNSEIAVGTPVVGHGLVYVTGGYPPVRPVYAVRPGGRGELGAGPDGDGEASEQLVWHHDTGGTYMPTPLVYGDHFYTLANNGILTCYDALTGERIYRQRVAGRGGVAFSASPVAARGRLYLASEDGDVYVVRAGADFELLATPTVGEVVLATPAIAGDVLYLRSLGHLYAFGAPAPSP